MRAKSRWRQLVILRTALNVLRLVETLRLLKSLIAQQLMLIVPPSDLNNITEVNVLIMHFLASSYKI